MKYALDLGNLRLPDYLTGRNSARPDYRIHQLNQICKNEDVLRRVEDSTSLTRDVRRTGFPTINRNKVLQRAP